MENIVLKRTNYKSSISTVRNFIQPIQLVPMDVVFNNTRQIKASLLIYSFYDFKALNGQIEELLQSTEQAKNEEYVTAVKFYKTKHYSNKKLMN